MNDLASTVKKIIEEVLVKMDFQGNAEISEEGQDFISANIQSDEAGWLIGKGAENLAALQQIIRAILNKKLGETTPRFSLDVNFYQKSRLETLTRMAKNLAEEVLMTGESRWLPPMSSFERRAVHLALVDFSGIKTESEGEREERRVVIKPVVKE